MKPKAGEKGFTLVELLVTISILAVVVAAASMAVITLMRLSPQSKDWNVALRQVQNAGYWISRDVQSSNTVNISPPSPQFLTFTIPTGPTTSKTIVYQFEDMAGGLKRLMRTEQVTGQPSKQTMIAEYIYYNPASDPTNSTKVISYQNRELTVRMAATSGKTTVWRQYEATQRVPP